MRTEPCACGGVIIAEDDVAEAVGRHNMSLTHVVWRYRREGPTAIILTCDVSACGLRASVPPGLVS